MNYKTEASPTQKMLNIWAIVLFTWSLYRYFFRTDLPVWFDEFIAKPLIFLIPIHYYITSVENKSFFKDLDFRRKNLLLNIGIGLLGGLIVAGIGYFLQRPNLTSLQLQTILFFIVVSFASSFSEEILSRGFVLKRLYDESKNAISSVFLASIFYFLIRVPIIFSNPDLFGITVLQIMMADILMSIAVSFAYLSQRNIVVPILIHAFYNLSIYLFILGS